MDYIEEGLISNVVAKSRTRNLKKYLRKEEEKKRVFR